MKIIPDKLQPDKTGIIAFRQKILKFARKQGRNLPWRKTDDPYKILISEFMLQQTQVARVINYYQNWIHLFPDFCSVSRAKKAAVLKAWSGLGYNSRALRLKECCTLICKQHGGILPESLDELMKLPGIGIYTASALLAFAYNKPVPVVDINIRRVYLHEFKLPTDISYRAISDFAKQFIPKGKSAEWHNALMDYGAALSAQIKKKFPPQTKQSKFDGSARQVRGEIIRRLLKGKSVAFTTLLAGIPHPDKTEILQKLITENIVSVKNGRYKIST